MNVEISRANDGCRNRHRVGKSGAATGMRSPVLTEATEEQKESKNDHSLPEASTRLGHQRIVKVQ